MRSNKDTAKFWFFCPRPTLFPPKQTKHSRGGWVCFCMAGETVATLPGLVACQHEIAVIEQGWQRVADSGPVLISKRVGAQIDIGPSEGLL